MSPRNLEGGKAKGRERGYKYTTPVLGVGRTKHAIRGGRKRGRGEKKEEGAGLNLTLLVSKLTEISQKKRKGVLCQRGEGEEAIRKFMKMLIREGRRILTV